MESVKKKRYITHLVKREKRYKVQPNLDSRTVLRNIIDRKLCADDRAISIYISICTLKLKVRALGLVVTIKIKSGYIIRGANMEQKRTYVKN